MSKENADWLGAIVERSKSDIGRVDAILMANNIKPSPVLASPRRLQLLQVAFSGEKVNVEDSGPFEFSWDDLQAGLWALLTESNLVGKSSVLEIIKWLIRGRVPSNLQDDVRSWVHHASLQFKIDETIFEVLAGTRNNNVKGELHRLVANKDPVVIGSFLSDHEFESVMSDFFLRMLSMDHLTTWRESGDKEESTGTTVTHGWNAFSGAMFIGTDYSVLLGDLPFASGVNARLMQMFLGIPWVSTLAAIKSALKAAQSEKDAHGRRRRSQDMARESRKSELNRELDAKLQELQSFAPDDELRNAIASLEQEYAGTKRREQALAERLERELEAEREADTALTEDKRDLQSHLDSEAAGAIFRLLDPSCCPRCDHSISDDKKKQEKLTHSCAVCGESVENDENSEAIKVSLEARIKASKQAHDKALKNVSEIRRDLINVRDQLSNLQGQIKSKSALLGNFEKRNALVMEIAVLRGRLQEASLATAPEEKGRIDDVITVLTAAEKETEERVKTFQGDILADVSERIVHYADRFGMHNLTSANLKAGAQLFLVKGGVSTSYSKVTDGEKLRLKVATVLAMMEVAERRGVGRHPGLLLVDSPGAQEVSPEDLDQLVGGLAEVSQSLPYFQVFVAAAGASSRAITKHVPTERRRVPSGSQYLW